MDIQIKKGVLEACVLAALKKGDSYGYQIIKDISHIIDISESTLYPILRRLEKADLLSTYNVEFESRIRKYYKITTRGKIKLDEFIEEWKELNKLYEYIKGDNLYE